MPKIPEDGIPQFSTNIQSPMYPYTREFGKLGGSLAATGTDIENAAFGVYEKVKQAEASDASAQAYSSDKIAAEKKLQELKLSSPDGYVHDPDTADAEHPQGRVVFDGNQPKTITQAFHEWADQQYQSSQKDMPSDLAQRMYRDRALNYFSDQTGLLQNEAQIMKVKAFDNNQDMRVKAAGDELVSNPDLKNFYQHAFDVTKDMNDQIGVMHNSTDAQTKIRSAYQGLSRDLMQGAYTAEILNKKEGDPTRVQSILKWRSVLDGTDPMSQIRKSQGLPTVSDMMDPSQKAAEEEKLIRLLPGAKKADLDNSNLYLKNLTSAAKVGERSMNQDRDIQNSLLMLNNQVVSGDRKQADAVERASELISSQAFGKMGVANRWASPEAQEQNLKDALNYTVAKVHEFAKSVGLPADYQGEHVRSEIEAKLRQQVQNDQAERRKDPFAYAAQPLPGHANSNTYASNAAAAVSQMDFSRPVAMAKSQNAKLIQQAQKDVDSLSLQAHIPADQITRIPNDRGQADTISHTLMDPNINGETTWNNMKGMRGGFGHYFPQAIDQLVKENRLSSAWALTRYVSPNISQYTGTQLMNAIKTPPGAQNPQFEAIAAANGVKESDFTSSIGQNMGPWLQAQEAANPSLAGKNFQAESVRVLTNMAKSYYVLAPGEGADAAAQKATDTIIKQFSHVLPTGQRGSLWGINASGVVEIPKSLASDQDAVNIVHNMAGRLTPDGIRALNPGVPPKPNGAPSDFSDKFAEVVAGGSPRVSFTWNGSNPGLNILYKLNTPDAPTGKLVKLMQKDGKSPIFIPLDEAKKPLPENLESPILSTLKKFNPFGGNTIYPSTMGGK